jgi:hypothetical protein
MRRALKERLGGAVYPPAVLSEPRRKSGAFLWSDCSAAQPHEEGGVPRCRSAAGTMRVKDAGAQAIRSLPYGQGS